ncbi:hypothetical protein OF83DRAFT_915546 [Amylostereum chailletii]|nr:hypothetical protein OF83DRAFT_915546 [Amylostereum chailletii]
MSGTNKSYTYPSSNSSSSSGSPYSYAYSESPGGYGSPQVKEDSSYPHTSGIPYYIPGSAYPSYASSIIADGPLPSTKDARQYRAYPYDEDVKPSIAELERASKYGPPPSGEDTKWPQTLDQSHRKNWATSGSAGCGARGGKSAPAVVYASPALSVETHGRYVVVPHPRPRQDITHSVFFRRLVYIGGKGPYMLDGLDPEEPQKNLYEPRSRPFFVNGRPISQKIVIHAEWPGYKAKGRASMQRIVHLRDGSITLEDAAFAAHECVRSELRRLQMPDVDCHPDYARWMIAKEGQKIGIFPEDVSPAGLVEFSPGHWQVVMHWVPRRD